MQQEHKPINDGGPAFPIPLVEKVAGGITHSEDGYGLGGMRLRDWFAGQALAGILANPIVMSQMLNESKSAAEAKEHTVIMAYQTADEMIAKRNTPSNE